MLIEFRCENHRSIRDEQALSMEAVLTEEIHAQVPRAVKGHKEKLLPAVALYGANASGKTNVLKALHYMKTVVTNSHRYWNPEDGILRHPFSWGVSKQQPSAYIAIFLLAGVRYEYGFEIDDSVVREEWLSRFVEDEEHILFTRDHDTYAFVELSGENEVIKSLTRANSLFLSSSAQNHHPELSAVFTWFNSIISYNIDIFGGLLLDLLPITYRIAGRTHEAAQFATLQQSENSNIQQSLQLLKDADIGVVDVRAEVIPVAKRNSAMPFYQTRYMLKHDSVDDDSWIDLDDESKGTRTLFYASFEIRKALQAGSVLLVDEIESSLHPILSAKLIDLFNSTETNPNNAQLIFTTHDTNLLGRPTGTQALRRDQIWFTEKDEHGGTNLYPLTDIIPRKHENLERGYLQGRYGAIPFPGAFDLLSETK